MASNVNVLGPGVLDIIAAESNGTAIITIQGNLIEDKAVVWYDRFQTLLSQLEIHGADVLHKDANQKFLRSLPSSLSQMALIMRIKPGLDTLSFDDLYNNLRVLERDVKGTNASSSSNSQNVAFMSTNNTSSTNDINDDDLEEMDLKWQVAMISMRIKKFYKRTCRKLQEVVDWSGHVEEDTQNFAMMAYSSSNSGFDNEVKSCSKTCEESYARLKKLYDKQRDKLSDASVEIIAYTLVLEKVEAQLLCHQQNQLAYEQKIIFMKIDLDDKTDVLAYHKKLLAEALKEKEDLKTKFENWQNSSKNLSRLLNTQMSANDKFRLGTPQQNRVAERKNRTLIEAARTMLADLVLPTTFWAEAVNTACNVLNRVLVTKPQNKTPYELLTGRQPNISYLRPFGCHVTILNTIDQLGKFDGKSVSRFLVGYSLNSKAFRVYNLETKRVEENPHVNLLENKPNVVGKGHAWMFDPDYLTNSMNYKPVSIENQANKSAGPQKANNSAGTQANDDQGANSEEIDLHDKHFILPIWSAYSTSVKSLGDKIGKIKKPDVHTNSTNLLNAVSTPVSAVGPSKALNDVEPSYPDDPSMPHLEDIYASPSAWILLEIRK
nr:retrovirus-related Pol polyprotein from transposon TNT 1-94 [Tanacetum cinerariifolium]